MAIWTAEIKELEKLYASIKGQSPDLEKELERLVKADDENMILLYSRRCLEVIITDLCGCELKRDRGTEPLKGILDKLNKEKKVPSNIIISMDHLNSLSAYGAHPKDFDPEQVKPVLNNLSTIIKWYLKYKEHRTYIKTRPSEETRQEIKSTENVKKDITISRKRLAGILGGSIGIIASVFAVLYFSNIVGSGSQTKEIEKSIAVLPFRNDSRDSTNQYFINGIMEMITTNLQMVKELRVISRTSVEQYRNNKTKSISEIAKELDVNYIMEGSGQKYENSFSITTQLIKAKGKETHLWAKTYKQEIKEVNDYIRIESQIAQAVATELKATITPEEKQLIEKTPTANLTAYDFYQIGREELTKFEVNNYNKDALGKAENLFHEALKYDSTFAQAYTGLASVYWSKHYWNEYFSENFLDSILIFTNKALSIDDQLSDAYILRGDYYYSKGLIDKAVKEYDLALKYNPNDYQAYIQKAYISLALEDYVATFDYACKAINRYHGGMLPKFLRDFAQLYSNVGFIDKAKYYYNEAYTLDGDSATYFRNIAGLEWDNENFDAAMIWQKKSFKIDSVPDYDNLVRLNIEGQHNEAYLLAVNLVKQVKDSGAPPLWHSHRIGYAFWKVGKLKEADYYFKGQIKYCTESIKLGREYASSKEAQYNLAATYAFLGDKEKAYQNLSEFSKLNFFPKWWITLIKYDPLFDNIKSEERFRKIIQNMEAKYQAEHERVRKWLEGQGML
jgi:TolB-like protein